MTELTDLPGLVAQAYVYDSYGEIKQQVGGLTNPYTYTGREFDAESELYFYRARTYDPITGRFFQVDPIGLAGGINLYTYVGNNSINLVDPFGLVDLKRLLKSPRFTSVTGTLAASLIGALSDELCPGPARGLVNLAGFIVAFEASFSSTAVSVSSAVAAFGSAPTVVGPVVGATLTLSFGALAVANAVAASNFLNQAIEDFRSSGKDCDPVCERASSK